MASEDDMAYAALSQQELSAAEAMREHILSFPDFEKLPEGYRKSYFKKYANDVVRHAKVLARGDFKRYTNPFGVEKTVEAK